MSIVGISFNFDEPLSQITFMIIHIIHVTPFCNLGDYFTMLFFNNSFIVFSLDYVCYL